MREAGATVSQAAAHFGVHAETVRRWIRDGAPCISTGDVGRGHGARLDLDLVAKWRAGRYGITGANDDDVMTLVETALLDVLRRDGGKGKPIAAELGISHEQATTLLTHAHTRIRRALNGGG